MRKLLFFCTIAILFAVVLTAQDFPDQYTENPNWGVNLGGETNIPPNYTGEYELFPEVFFWNRPDADLLNWRAKSFKIETVSFPFVPVCVINGTSCFTPSTRTFYAKSFDDIGVIYYNQYVGNPPSIEGTGWGNDLFFKTNIFEWNESYNFALISTAFVHDQPSDYRLRLPHSILKYTIYIHYDDDPTSVIIDSLSWIVDNTRGRMNNYPFYHDNVNLYNTMIGVYDLTLLPRIRYDNSGPWSHPYNIGTNNYWYFPPDESNSGSANYFPYGEVALSQYEIVHPGEIPGPYFNYDNNHWTHPPKYSFLYCPVRNQKGKAYAGYDNYGYYGNGNAIESGINHDYHVTEVFDLSIINPEEEIIYIPDSVYFDFSGTMIIPCNYKLLTVHGKPPSKDLIDEWKLIWKNKNIGFKYERDIPAPSDQGMSTIILAESATIYFKPDIIIMDVRFEGEGTIIRDESRTHGNFEVASSVNEVFVEMNFDCEDSGGLPDKKSSSIIDGSPDYINICPNPSNTPVTIKCYKNSDSYSNLEVVDIMGKSVKKISVGVEPRMYEFQINDLKAGIYHVVLFTNEQLISTEKLIVY